VTGRHLASLGYHLSGRPWWRKVKQLPILGLCEPSLKPSPQYQLLELPLCDRGENDGSDQISFARLILPGPPRSARPPASLWSPVPLLEPL